jgi:hypothetical protein
MYVFHYDPTTLAYVRASPVDFCQLEPGRVLVPAWASDTPPPKGWDSAKEWPFFVPATGRWQLRPLAPAALPAVEESAAIDPAAPADPEELKARLQAHLDAAQELIDAMKGAAA